MARDPGSIWSPLPEAGAPDGFTKTQFIVHSTGTLATAAANRNYFAKGEVVVESTFIIGQTADDPTLQIMDSTDNADANGSANQRGISVETVGRAGDPFTDWQIKELIRLGRWAGSVHPIQKRVIPTESGSGYGWHVMFGAPGPWTSVVGKECPGPVRIGQLKNTVFPAIFSGTAPALEDDMPSLDEFRKAVLDVDLGEGAGTLSDFVRRNSRIKDAKGKPAPVANATLDIDLGGGVTLAKFANGTAPKPAGEVAPATVGALDVDAFAELVADKLAARLRE